MTLTDRVVALLSMLMGAEGGQLSEADVLDLLAVGGLALFGSGPEPILITRPRSPQ